MLTRENDENKKNGGKNLRLAGFTMTNRDHHVNIIWKSVDQPLFPNIPSSSCIWICVLELDSADLEIVPIFIVMPVSVLTSAFEPREFWQKKQNYFAFYRCDRSFFEGFAGFEAKTQRLSFIIMIVFCIDG